MLSDYNIWISELPFLGLYLINRDLAHWTGLSLRISLPLKRTSLSDCACVYVCTSVSSAGFSVLVGRATILWRGEVVMTERGVFQCMWEREWKCVCVCVCLSFFLVCVSSFVLCINDKKYILYTFLMVYIKTNLQHIYTFTNAYYNNTWGEKTSHPDCMGRLPC